MLEWILQKRILRSFFRFLVKLSYVVVVVMMMCRASRINQYLFPTGLLFVRKDSSLLCNLCDCVCLSSFSSSTRAFHLPPQPQKAPPVCLPPSLPNKIATL